MTTDNPILAALRKFAREVTTKMRQVTAGEPEDQLRGPFEMLMREAGKALGREVVCIGQSRLPGRLGKPDFAVNLTNLLCGYAELKAPGVGVNTKRFTGHNREQWQRFQAIPNLLYADGNSWGLYRSGELVRPIVRLSGDVSTDGVGAAALPDAEELGVLLADFFAWHPILPTKADGRIDFRRFADMLAPLCRMLRDNVSDALRVESSPLVDLARDWRQLLFPEADDFQFADAYAQTVTFALLLARSEGADPLTLESAQRALSTDHALLSRALQVLTDPGARTEISASLDLLLRVISVVPPGALAGADDPWIYFYEDFLATYDPKLRKDAGAYYTPVEVVHAQVRLIDDLLKNHLGKPLGFVDGDVTIMDPAVGTGTYLLGVIDHALGQVKAAEGPGAVPAQATALAERLYGFEIMVGPFAVSELRVSRAIVDRGGTLPDSGTHVYLTDTLESPNAIPPQLPFILKAIADQHSRALAVKDQIPIIVCLGNPPYDRTVAADSGNRGRTGGWVRWGDDPNDHAIFKDFVEPAVAAGHAVRVHNIYNLYVYFWRWAMWKVFEHHTAPGPGVVSFISASSYLDGDAFCGVREHMRRHCDDIWVIDLGGERRGTRKSENVFAIQTPVAIAILMRRGGSDLVSPAKVRYARIDGSREEKLRALEDLHDLNDLTWHDCPDGWRSPFRPAGVGTYFEWPQLTELLPWYQAGVKAGRTWVIAPDVQSLNTRWRALCAAAQHKRADLFKESPTGRKVSDRPNQLPPASARLKSIASLSGTSPLPQVARFGHRSFDRHFILADARLIDRPSPSLWQAHSSRQLYITTLLNHPLGSGPAVTATGEIPDLHHFRGSFGAKEVFPLYRTSAGTDGNVTPGLLDLLGEEYGRVVVAEDLVAYVYGILAQPAFTENYAAELETRELRVPLTRDSTLFERAREIGARLLWLHTYATRYVPEGMHGGGVPPGVARCVKPIPGDVAGYPAKFWFEEPTQVLHVGEGEFGPVAPEVYGFDVSGFRVVRSWLSYRMKSGAGRRSSSLDDIRSDVWTPQFTTELLQLLWLLEATVAGYEAQAEVLSAVVAGRCFAASDLPAVPESARQPPHAELQETLFDLPQPE